MKEPASNYDLQVDIGRRIFLEYDQEALIRKFALQADAQWRKPNEKSSYYSNPKNLLPRLDGKI